jgi:hypothetical protein
MNLPLSVKFFNDGFSLPSYLIHDDSSNIRFLQDQNIIQAVQQSDSGLWMKLFGVQD